MALTFFLMAGYLLASLFNGRKAPANPWGGATLEWQCSSPPPHENFATTPIAGDPYDYSKLVYDPQLEGWVEALPERSPAPVPTPATARNPDHPSSL